MAAVGIGLVKRSLSVLIRDGHLISAAIGQVLLEFGEDRNTRLNVDATPAQFNKGAGVGEGNAVVGSDVEEHARLAAMRQDDCLFAVL